MAQVGEGEEAEGHDHHAGEHAEAEQLGGSGAGALRGMDAGGQKACPVAGVEIGVRRKLGDDAHGQSGEFLQRAGGIGIPGCSGEGDAAETARAEILLQGEPG